MTPCVRVSCLVCVCVCVHVCTRVQACTYTCMCVYSDLRIVTRFKRPRRGAEKKKKKRNVKCLKKNIYIAHTYRVCMRWDISMSLGNRTRTPKELWGTVFSNENSRPGDRDEFVARSNTYAANTRCLIDAVLRNDAAKDQLRLPHIIR